MMKFPPIHIFNSREEYFIDPEEILYAEPSHNYTNIHLVNGIQHNNVPIRIKELNKRLESYPYPKYHLLMLGRSLIINTLYIKNRVAQTKSIELSVLDKKGKPIQLTISASAMVTLTEKLAESAIRNNGLVPVTSQLELVTPLCELNREHPKENGHEYVDLGLPSGTLWATEDVEMYKYSGPNYFRWGELMRRTRFTIEDYKNFDAVGDVETAIVFNYDYGYKEEETNMTVLQKDRDVASKKWGGRWRIPKASEWYELAQYCKWQSCIIRGAVYPFPSNQKIFLVTGPNGNRIIFSEEGAGIPDYYEDVCDLPGARWTACSYEIEDETAYAFTFFQDLEETEYGRNLMIEPVPRSCGLQIRPVFKRE